MAVGLCEETMGEWELISSSKDVWGPWLAEHPEVDYALFSWAKATVMSRQHASHPSMPDGEEMVIPTFDLLNHDPTGEPNVELDYEGEGDTAQVVLRSCRAIAPGDELRISYGPLPNASLCITYGFVATENTNPFDCVELVLSFPLSAARRPRLQGLEAVASSLAQGYSVFDLLGSTGEGPNEEIGTRHNLTRRTPLPPTLLATVRLQVFSEEDLAGLGAAPDALCAATKASGEQAAVSQLRKLLQSLLSGHSTGTVESDSAILAAEPPPAQRLRMAVIVRKAEKEILQAALRALDDCATVEPAAKPKVKK
eukprot:gnl/TRDRNA2_/TRDRNA2_73536_c0_seq2.p1 gnl/TRDRNA2_/TRDRNA2_73536_c0~~gnl/TRDRNA2_/TRDRNA2_73536_c0_seq2.p1  ORF type:complete len:311 (+),score=73.34 gnl/TRDRNA2_/TRDRNA2_73536_c0_seq2:384-1316(+)